MTQLAMDGIFLADLVDQSVDITRNGYPQFTGRFNVVQFYPDTPELLAHYKITEPAFQDYPSEEIVGFFVLFGKDGELKNYAQLKSALGWDGTSFESLDAGEFPNKRVMIRVENEEYNGKTSLRVKWIDAANADPSRSLKKADAATLKNLNSFLAGAKAAAKPATAPASAPNLPKVAALPPVQSPAAKEKKTTKKETVASAPPAAAPPAVSAPPVSAPSVAASPITTAPAETTQGEAWAYCLEHCVGYNEAQVGDAWIKEGGKLALEVKHADDKFTPSEWATLRDRVRGALIPF